MVELRWVLLGLGAALLLGVYLWGRGVLQRFLPQRALARRWLPSRPELDSERASSPAEPEAPPESPRPADAEAVGIRATSRPDRVITVRFIPKNKQLSAEKAILALRSAGLQHGRYGIFHRLSDESPEALFSVASLTEPGSFDLTNLGKPIAGMSFFIVLPGDGDPVARFDMMVETARSLAHDLDAELHDERGSSWSIQRERYVREEIIEYRHQHAHA
ncbi:MAG TPA: cell division protein ZipA C-terminal FtsZ-binding domain-containing protein [Gammaproteobacteria bacterium]|jgi:cell division protein ZipA